MKSKSIFEHFQELPDPREDNRRHKLLDIITIIICASICGAEKWDDIEAFGKAKESWLRKFLELPHGIPSHDTFARVFGMLEPDAVNRCFSGWVEAIHPKNTKEIINIDGKTVRRSHDRSRGKSAIHMVSAWANTAGLILGQKRVNEKTNEITAIPELLDMLEIEGCVITIDAMGTQKEVTKKIIEKNGDYILAVKGNHGTLQEDVELFFEGIEEMKEPNDQFDYYKTLDKDHGRIESREYWVTTDIDWFDGKEKWEDLKSFCMMKTKRTVGDHTSSEKLFYISSMDAEAQTIGPMIRSHWGIENSLHWVLDVAFREDECRKRKNNSAENFAVLRHITLNLLKQEKTCKRSIAGKRLLAGWDQTYMEKILFKT